MIKIGICRAPSYFDMFYIETDADIKTFNSLYKEKKGLTYVIATLRSQGYTVNLFNMNFLIEEDSNEIQKVNKLKL